MNRNYFRYLFRTYKVLILFFLAMYLCICLLWNLFSDPGVAGHGFYSSVRAGIALSITLTYALPVLLFSFAHKKSSADVFFALPLSRRELRLTTLAFAFCISFGYWFITAIISWLFYAFGVYSFLSLLVLAIYTAVMILGLLVIHSFIYLLANNVLDGIVLLGAYTMIFIAAFVAELAILEQMIAGFVLGESPISFLLSPLVCFTANYAALISKNGWLYVNFRLQWLIPALAYTLLAWFGLRREFDERKSERAEMISDHPLAYPAVIHFYLFVSLAIVISDMVVRKTLNDLIFVVLLLICYILGTFLYRRKLEIRPKNIGIFALMCVLCCILLSSMWATRGFGMAESYSLKEGETLNYDYSINTDPKDLSAATREMENCVFVHFELHLPTDRLEEYGEVIGVLDAYRREEINTYYRNPEETGKGYFAVYNETQNQEKNRWNYAPGKGLSEADLEIIDRYGDVYVRRFTETGDIDVLLETYLKERN